MAGSLVTRRTGVIGLIMPDINNPFFPGIARGAEDKANESGYSIIFCNTDDNLEVEEKYIESLTSKMVDGIIIAHSSSSEKTSEILERCQIPIILIDRDFDARNIRGKVLVNNKDGSYKGVSHLIRKGYRKIAFLSGSLKTKTAQDRLQGYLKALQENSIPVEESLIRYGEYRSERGRDGIRSLLEDKVALDAVFCGNDLIAIGAMKELKKNGLRIPQDIGVMGFDDIYMASQVYPRLTTVRQPLVAMGETALEQLVTLLEGRPILTHRRELPTELIIRESTGRPRKT
jgi:LacI family transcriptional regulator